MKKAEIKLSSDCNKLLDKYKWSLKNPMYIDKKDKRYNKHVKQLKVEGFSDTESWSLDSVLSMFILPRLVRFREVANGFPFCEVDGKHMTMEKWHEILHKMIFAFEWNIICEEEGSYKLSDEIKKANWDKYQEGMALFAKYFRDLWW